MNDLAAVKSWDVAGASQDPSNPDTFTSTQLVGQLIQAGNDEVAVLDKVAAAKTPDDVLAIAAQVVGAERSFTTRYDIARSQIAGSAQPGQGTPGAPEVTPAVPPAATPAESVPSPRSV
jgi:hypothetical protein